MGRTAMRKLYKFAFVFILTAILTICLTETSIFANENIQGTCEYIYSPEFPNAYIETSDDQNSVSLLNDIKITEVTVYVQEIIDNESNSCISSKLLSKEEIDVLKASDINNAIYPRTTSTYQKLKLIFSIPSQSSNNTYDLHAYAKWSGGSGISGPAAGDDFVGFAWGGKFDSFSRSISGRTIAGSSMSFYSADYIANTGCVWGFNESAPQMDYLNAYITLNKNTLTGGGNTTAFVAKYIHTYQSSVGNISLSVTSSGVGGGFTLSSCPKQWSLVTTLTGFQY